MSEVVGYSENRRRLQKYIYDYSPHYIPEYKQLNNYKVIYHATNEVTLVSRYRGQTYWVRGLDFENACFKLIDRVFIPQEFVEGKAVGHAMNVERFLSLAESQGKVRTVEGFKPAMICRPLSKLIPECMTEVRSVLSEHPASVVAEDYERSTDKFGDKLTNKLFKLLNDVDHNIDVDTICRAFLLTTVATFPHMNGECIRAEPHDPYDLDELHFDDTSIGLPPFHYPNKARSKKDVALEAIADIWTDYFEQNVNVEPLIPRAKEEAIPIEKDMRYIFVPTIKYIMMERALFGKVIHTPKNPFTGNFNNFMTGSNASSLFLAVMAGDDKRDPLDLMFDIIYTDINSSEFTQAPEFKAILALIKLNTVRVHPFYRYALAEIIANYMWPKVAIKDNKVVDADNLFSSGFTWTLMGNTTNYQAAHLEALYEMWRKWMKMTINGPWPKKIETSSSEITKVARTSAQQGDDHYRPKTPNGKLLDDVKPWRFGFKMTYKEGTLFEAEFLRKKIRVIDGMPRMVADAGRTLAKAWHLRGTPADVREGLDSLKMEVGDDEVFEVLAKAARVITRRHYTLQETDRNPEVRSGRIGSTRIANALLHAPSHQVYRLIRNERAAADFGMSSILLAAIATERKR